ncbi:MAG: SDR family oxidoreductase [Clostridia bacterium]|nr:SDR family oxidoreductase [Clostridia bacterium]
MKKIAIITGASSGIGREFARTLASHGSYDEVWAIARNTERLEALKNDVPFPVCAVSLDLTLPSSFEKIKEMLKAESPNVGILINCSGYGKFESFEKTSEEDNIGMIDLNCRALAMMTQAALPYMSEGSEIINIASVAAFQPIPYINIYGATKAFVLSFSRALGRELKSRGIRVLAVCPFWTKTAFFDRAVNKNEDAVVKKYVAMYEPSFIVKKAWRALGRKHKDFVIPGFKAKMQVLAVKILPHGAVMSIWQSQQKLK